MTRPDFDEVAEYTIVAACPTCGEPLDHNLHCPMGCAPTGEHTSLIGEAL